MSARFKFFEQVTARKWRRAGTNSVAPSRTEIESARGTGTSTYNKYIAYNVANKPHLAIHPLVAKPFASLHDSDLLFLVQHHLHRASLSTDGICFVVLTTGHKGRTTKVWEPSQE